MLVSLNVKNFAIIDNVNIDFENGMTVLVGETGAGKSLIIDAIGLLFGDRASSDLVRSNETKASIEGVFINYSDKLNQLLEEFDIDIDEQLIVKREIYSNGKSTCKVNGCAISLSQLDEISSFLGDIHTQYDTIRLINPKNYLNFIDDENTDCIKLEYKNSLKEYKKTKKKLEDLIRQHDEEARQLDFFVYQSKELDKAKLSIDEEVELKKQADYLNNYEQIATLVQEVSNELDDVKKLYEASNNLQKLCKYDNKYEKMASTILDCYYLIDDVANELSKISFDDNGLSQLDYINERLMVYSDLRRKYKMTTEEIINYHSELKHKINSFENYDDIIKDLQLEADKEYRKTMEIALRLRNERQKTAKVLENEVINALNDLELKHTFFSIDFNLDNDKFLENGIDEVSYMVSFNVGEVAKPLNKVASGGELSRFMLALKSVLSKHMENQTIIFDEIDSGVSGKVAYAIAKKIHSISQYAQVLCITHLPQVAACCEHQLSLSKQVAEGRTFTSIKNLDYNERIEEIAKMISNGSVTESARLLAKELLSDN